MRTERRNFYRRQGWNGLCRPSGASTDHDTCRHASRYGRRLIVSIALGLLLGTATGESAAQGSPYDDRDAKQIYEEIYGHPLSDEVLEEIQSWRPADLDWWLDPDRNLQAFHRGLRVAARASNSSYTLRSVREHEDLFGIEHTPPTAGGAGDGALVYRVALRPDLVTLVDIVFPFVESLLRRAAEDQELPLLSKQAELTFFGRASTDPEIAAAMPWIEGLRNFRVIRPGEEAAERWRFLALAMTHIAPELGPQPPDLVGLWEQRSQTLEAAIASYSGSDIREVFYQHVAAFDLEDYQANTARLDLFLDELGPAHRELFLTSVIEAHGKAVKAHPILPWELAAEHFSRLDRSLRGGSPDYTTMAMRALAPGENRFFEAKMTIPAMDIKVASPVLMRGDTRVQNGTFAITPKRGTRPYLEMKPVGDIYRALVFAPHLELTHTASSGAVEETSSSTSKSCHFLTEEGQLLAAGVTVNRAGTKCEMSNLKEVTISGIEDAGPWHLETRVDIRISRIEASGRLEGSFSAGSSFSILANLVQPFIQYTTPTEAVFTLGEADRMDFNERQPHPLTEMQVCQASRGSEPDAGGKSASPGESCAGVCSEPKELDAEGQCSCPEGLVPSDDPERPCVTQCEADPELCEGLEPGPVDMEIRAFELSPVSPILLEPWDRFDPLPIRQCRVVTRLTCRMVQVAPDHVIQICENRRFCVPPRFKTIDCREGQWWYLCDERVRLVDEIDPMFRCQEGETRCVGNGSVQGCRNGFWAEPESCAGSCDTQVGQCSANAQCLEGETRCALDNSRVEVCQGGAWAPGESCELGCLPELGICADLSIPHQCWGDERRCVENDSAVQSCENNFWGPVEDCPFGCDPVSTLCQPYVYNQCEDGERRCALGGTHVQFCTEGRWDELQQCPFGCDEETNACLQQSSQCDSWYPNRCSVLGQKTCSTPNLLICDLNEDNCLAWRVEEECELGCSQNACVESTCSGLDVCWLQNTRRCPTALEAESCQSDGQGCLRWQEPASGGACDPGTVCELGVCESRSCDTHGDCNLSTRFCGDQEVCAACGEGDDCGPGRRCDLDTGRCVLAF